MKRTVAPNVLYPIAALLILTSLAGCGALDKALGARRPTARIVGVKLRGITLTSVTLLFNLEVGNPYSVGLPLASIDYSLSSEGSQFLSGQSATQGTVPAGGTKVFDLPLELQYLGLLRVLREVRPGAVVPYEAELGLSVEAPALGRVRLPLRKEGRIPIPAPPRVAITEIRWDKLSLDHAGGRVRLELTNRNRFAMTLARLTYALSLGGMQVAKSSLAQPASFEADGGTGAVEIPISFAPKALGLAALRILTGEGAGYKLHGTMDVQTDFGPISLPIEGIGKAIFRRTGG